MKLLVLPIILSLTACGPVGQTRAQVEAAHPTWAPTASATVSAPGGASYDIQQYRHSFLEPVLERCPERHSSGPANWILVEHTLVLRGGVVTGYNWSEIASQAYGNGETWPAWVIRRKGEGL